MKVEHLNAGTASLFTFTISVSFSPIFPLSFSSFFHYYGPYFRVSRLPSSLSLPPLPASSSEKLRCIFSHCVPVLFSHWHLSMSYGKGFFTVVEQKKNILKVLYFGSVSYRLSFKTHHPKINPVWKLNVEFWGIGFEWQRMLWFFS